MTAACDIKSKSLRTSFILICILVTQGCAESARAKGLPEYKMPEIKKDCTACHTSHDVKKGTPALKKPVSELCIECHPDRKAPNEHKVDVVPKMKPEGLPLADGRMTCVTCHDPHDNKYGSLLRMTENKLCLTCHKY